LIWVLNPEYSTLDQLVSRLREYCTDYLDNMPIFLALKFPDEVPATAISREMQRNVFLTVKEAINNSVKHSGADKMTITLTLGNDKMQIAVSDNGKGFDMEKLKRGGNGLINMRQRIEQIGGVFEIISTPANTSINIVIGYPYMYVAKVVVQ
jgi:signal transduction histidine kinase